MTREQILNATTLTKTAKMLSLFELGFTRKQVAEMLGVGYGFVQNVYARRYSTERRTTTATTISTEWSFTRKFGVEIEAYNVERTTLVQKLQAVGIRVESESYNHSTRPHWKIVSDSSVQGANAFEIVSPPLQGLAGLQELNIVCTVLNECGAKVNKSCGLHIHFDASNFQLHDWKNLYRNYAQFEDNLDAMLPTSRRANNNGYCRSMKVRTLANKIANASSLEELSRAITSRSRYYKLNTESYFRHRTVEFRQHSGTTEFNKIQNWILICAQLLDYSHTNAQGATELRSILQPAQQEYYLQRCAHFA